MAETWQGIHELLQVKIQVLKNKVQPPLCMDDIMQAAAKNRGT
jgi:hypothetical protein